MNKIAVIACVAGLTLQGCTDKKDKPDHDGKCTGDIKKDEQNMVGCWVGNSTNQDFWVNFAYDEDKGLSAKWIMGPAGSGTR